MVKKNFLLILIFLSLAPFVFAQDMTIDGNGNVGIGTSTPTEKLSVNGIIESTGGGIKFPDGSVQVTASSGGGGGGGSYVKVAVVAQGGGDYTDPLAAMNDIATWCGTPSASNPCLLKIMPGVYNLGAMTLQMIPYVDIEGSGENTTKITSNFGDNSWTGVVNGADFAEIRFLTIENTGGGIYAIAIYIDSSSPKLTNITAISSGANENVCIMCQTNCSSTMTNVTATASGGTLTIGVYIEGNSSPFITNLNATASDGVTNLGFDFNNNSSPTVTNVTTIALRGTNTHGLHINGASSPIMNNVTTIAMGATNENYAVYNINSSSPVMTNVTAEASGSNSYGIYSKNFASYTGGIIRIDHAVIKGTTNAIYTDTTFTTLVGNTRLGGSMIGAGTNTCAGVYDDNYTFYTASCP